MMSSVASTVALWKEIRQLADAGSHKAAQRAAMVYSLLASCKIHQVNPQQWLSHVLENIMSTKYNAVMSIYPST